MGLIGTDAAVGSAATGLRPSGADRLRAWQALLLAAAGGLALAAAFPPAGIWPLAVLGPALLTIALWRQRLRTVLAVGAVFGLAFFFPLISWLVNVAWYVWTALAVAESVIFAVLTIGQWLLLRLPAWPLGVAGWWVVAEAMRDRWPWAFPWGRLAMSQAGAPTARWVSVGGPTFLTFLLALVAGCLAWLLLAGNGLHRAGRPGSLRRPVRRSSLTAASRALALPALALPALAVAASAALALCGALLPAGPGSSAGSSAGPAAVVAAVQGNVPHARNLPDELRATTVTQNHATATDKLAASVRAGRAPDPDLVIWPENSTDIDPGLDPDIYNLISGSVSDLGRPVLVGAVLENPERNVGQLWLPGQGPVALYVKRQLVPFGEVIPFRSLLTKITSLPDLQPVNFTPGHSPVVFRIGKIRLGDVICYEVGFDGLVASEVKAGANLLTEQTNDADFEIDGQTGESLQQLAMARMRAVEFDRSVVVAGTTGVSAIIAPDGTLIARTRTWQQAVLDKTVPLRSATTLAARLGGWPEAVLTFATIAAMLLALVRLGWRRRRARAE